MAKIRTAETFIRTRRGRNPPPSLHIEGVALMLAPEAHGALIGWEPANSRIITGKKKDLRLNIIQCYALTNDAEEEKRASSHNYKQC